MLYCLIYNFNVYHCVTYTSRSVCGYTAALAYAYNIAELSDDPARGNMRFRCYLHILFTYYQVSIYFAINGFHLTFMEKAHFNV